MDQPFGFVVGGHAGPVAAKLESGPKRFGFEDRAQHSVTVKALLEAVDSELNPSLGSHIQVVERGSSMNPPLGYW